MFSNTSNGGRKRRNHIARIEDEFGNVFPEEEDIQRVFVDYYSKLFTAKNNMEMEEMVGAMSCKLSREIQDELSQLFTEDEVPRALHQMHPCKASGHDGMSALFFQKFWRVVGKSVIHSTLDVLNNGASPATLNHIYIALISKVKCPYTPAEFRPISLYNVSFKIITKIIANRLKRYLPSIIDPSQSAFVPGRLITDNALLAYEVFHNMKHYWGVRVAKEKGFRKVTLEMDSQITFFALQNQKPNFSYLGGMIDDIISCCSDLECVKFSWVRRNTNKAAHFMANYAFNCVSLLCSASIPEAIVDITSADNLAE